MKTKIKYILLIITLVFTFSCNFSNDKKQNLNTSNKEVAVSENIKNIELDIEGMTCEIGCARLIQSKLYKTDGVKFAEVSFENKLGKITFDANKISTEDIKERIHNIAGGDLYKVTKSREVESFATTN